MSTYAFVASHHTVDLTTVAALSAGASGIPDVLSSDDARQLGVTGSVVLATCNRLEMYVQLPIAAHLPAIRDMITSSISGRSGLDSALVSGSFDLCEGEDAVRHLLTVASGLESAVVGEREIAGQVRRALASAQEKAQRDERPLPGELVQLFEHAAHTARQVGQHTLLGSQGRSIVSVALDLADEVTEKDWPTRRALVFGTGAYAGATIAALRDRGCTDIWVNSRSGRAPEFAAKRDVFAVPEGGMEQAMAEADLIIGCSGGSAPLQPEQIPAGHHTILDLALSRDFDPSVADLPNVELITLESVRLAAPEETEEAVATALRIVESELAAFLSRQRARTIDSAIVALRSHTMAVLDSELEKARNQFGCGAAAEQLEIAMRRTVKSLLHTPTVRAKMLAAQGRTDEYVHALEVLYGIQVADD